MNSAAPETVNYIDGSLQFRGRSAGTTVGLVKVGREYAAYRLVSMGLWSRIGDQTYRSRKAAIEAGQAVVKAEFEARLAEVGKQMNAAAKVRVEQMANLIEARANAEISADQFIRAAF